MFEWKEMRSWADDIAIIARISLQLLKHLIVTCSLADMDEWVNICKLG